MHYRYILAFDPSGNFHEGKGTTGWVLINDKEDLLERGYITAKQYRCPEEYWQAHLDVLHKYYHKYKGNLIVVIEDYVLYRDKSTTQTNSRMETCRLIGLLQWKCWRLKQPYTMQLASSVKVRWSDELLLREGILYRKGKDLIHARSNISLGLVHSRDAFRHALHYAVTRNTDYHPDPYFKPKKYVKTKKSNYETEDYDATSYNDNYNAYEPHYKHKTPW